MDQKEKAGGGGRALGMSSEFLRPRGEERYGRNDYFAQKTKESLVGRFSVGARHTHINTMWWLLPCQYIRLESGVEKGGKQVGGTNPFCHNASSSFLSKMPPKYKRRNPPVIDFGGLCGNGGNSEKGGGAALARRGRTLACEGGRARLLVYSPNLSPLGRPELVTFLST